MTIVEGSSFSVCAGNGDMFAAMHHGVYFQDTRFVSGWRLLLNGDPVEALAAMVPEPYRAVFVGRAERIPGQADMPLVVERERRVGSGVSEQLTLQNYSASPIHCAVELTVAADFADLFEVKGDRIVRAWERSGQARGDALVIQSEWKGHTRGLTVTAHGATVSGDSIRYDVTVPARGRWATRILATPSIDGVAIPSEFGMGIVAGQTRPARRLRAWAAKLPVPSIGDSSVAHIIERSELDLGSLRIHDPANPEREVVAAGAPWFMALFGRDSLLTSYMAMPVDPELALGTLQTLADYQGKVTDHETEEQPGRILHEVRLGLSGGIALGARGVYYGSVDATPLFVVVLGELWRWCGIRDDLVELIGPADRALEWMLEHGDRDGDGFIEYARMNDEGLFNQGWKDSWDGINFAEGLLAEPPIALCEAQGYAYSAYLARALMARETGDPEGAREWLRRAEELKARFNEAFWLPDRGYYAVALDRDKRPVDALASNMGHCLWSGIVDEDKAPAVAEHLLSDELFSGWGVRTLATNMGAYNPASYHNGSVWPHDNALIVAGLARYGFMDHARRVTVAMLDAADAFGGRLPELFCGFDRATYPEPVPYPTSCSPQAWASAAPVQLLRSLARLDPSIPDRELWVAPAFPDGFGEFAVNSLPLGTSRLDIDLTDNIVRVSGLPGGITLHTSPRPVAADVEVLRENGRME